MNKHSFSKTKTNVAVRNMIAAADNFDTRDGPATLIDRYLDEQLGRPEQGGRGQHAHHAGAALLGGGLDRRLHADDFTWAPPTAWCGLPDEAGTGRLVEPLSDPASSPPAGADVVRPGGIRDR